MKSRSKKPFVVAWNHRRLKLSDGSTQKEFFNQEEALDFIEEEIKKVKFPLSRQETRDEYRNVYGTEPTQGQIQCTREMKGNILLYGVSDFYIVPSKNHVARVFESQS